MKTASVPTAEFQTEDPYIVQENSLSVYVPFICYYDVLVGRTQWLSTEASHYNLNFQKLEVVGVGDYVSMPGNASSKTFAIVLQPNTDATLDRECHSCHNFQVTVNCADSYTPNGGIADKINIEVSDAFEAPVVQTSSFPTIYTSEISYTPDATVGSK